MMIRDQHKLPIRILICDDDASDRARLRQTLHAARLANDLHVVESGKALLDYLHQRGPYAGETGVAPRPGLILLALSVTKRDGRDALRHVREDATLRQIPVVAVAASRVDVEILRTYHLGVDAFITKPVTFAELTTAINTLDRYWLEIVEVPPVPA
jgi:CheY-like chemotaxis protein